MMKTDFRFRGFSQHDGCRQLQFEGLANKTERHHYHLVIEMATAARHGVLLQDLPQLGMYVLLRAEATGDAAALQACTQYRLAAEDYISFTAPRRQAAAVLAERRAKLASRPRPAAPVVLPQPVIAQ